MQRCYPLQIQIISPGQSRCTALVLKYQRQETRTNGFTAGTRLLSLILILSNKRSREHDLD